MSIFEKLKAHNQFPIMFIGSGISRRYASNFYSWIELLENLWQDLNLGVNFYGQYKLLEDQMRNDFEHIEKRDLEYVTNLAIADLIASEYNKAVYEERIAIDNLTPKDYFDLNKSPIKEAVSRKLKDLELLPEKSDEIELFQKALLKSQVIFTTNYDTLIEDLYNTGSSYQIKKYVGQKGFFKNSQGYAELFKIHGCISDSNSLVFLKKDYDNYDKNSILISATIISLMLNSPIIFLGYSLTDINVRKYIADFANAAFNEGQDLSEKLIVVEYEKGQSQLIEEVVHDQELNCKFTYVRTDNFAEIYKFIGNIDQGIAPSEIRKYQSLIKQIIVDVGKQGQLRSVLVSPNELNQIEKLLEEKGVIENNIVVAFGDSKSIFKIPVLIDFLQNYYLEEELMPLDLALMFISNAQLKSRLPYLKYVNEATIQNSNISDLQKEKLKQRLAKHSDLGKLIETIPSYGRQTHSSLAEILALPVRKYVKYALLTYNIEKLPEHDIENFIRGEITTIVEIGENTVDTNLRRLMLAHDILVQNKK